MVPTTLFLLSALKMILFSQLPVIVAFIFVLKRKLKKDAYGYVFPIALVTFFSGFLAKKLFSFTWISFLFPLIKKYSYVTLSATNWIPLISFKIIIFAAVFAPIQFLFLKYGLKEKRISAKPFVLIPIAHNFICNLLWLILATTVPYFAFYSKCNVMLVFPYLIFAVPVVYLYLIYKFVRWLMQNNGEQTA